MVVDAKPKDQKLPTDAYYSVEEVHDVSLLWITTVGSFFLNYYFHEFFYFGEFLKFMIARCYFCIALIWQ